MKEYIKVSLQSQNITVTESELNDLIYRWRSLTEMNSRLLDTPHGTMQIALQSLPEGDIDG